MIKIIPPQQFNKTPWKNGKGETTELAINDGGTLESFDWRMSMAKVTENGAFSYFSGYLRNLILIEGNGILLQHDQSRIDKLEDPLSFATFDGGCYTVATLPAGSIADINIITKADKYHVSVETFIKQQDVQLRASTHCFIFCLDADSRLFSADKSTDIILKYQHLMLLSSVESEVLQVNGRNMIVVHLDEIV